VNPSQEGQRLRDLLKGQPGPQADDALVQGGRIGTGQEP
jgi:hypothetical protein